jgi:predicted DNA-binding transcriptional regulator AlpA
MMTERQIRELETDPLACITKRELAKLLRVNKWTIDHWRKRGWLPAEIVASPQLVLWRRKDIDEWLEAKKANPATVRRPLAKEET